MEDGYTMIKQIGKHLGGVCFFNLMLNAICF